MKRNYNEIIENLNDNDNKIILKIRNISNYFSFSPQIAYKLIKVGNQGTFYKYKVYL